MVMLVLSLRAVLRNESWMFCAGLLPSIADLLRFFDAPAATALAVPAALRSPGNLAVASTGSKTDSSARQTIPSLAASTIRGPSRLFNRNCAAAPDACSDSVTNRSEQHLSSPCLRRSKACGGAALPALR